MITATVRDKLEREIARTENHLDALYEILDEVNKEAPKRKAPENVNNRIPLIEQALAKVRGTRTFSVKELTGFARRIEPDVDRRTIYNCIKGYLQRNLENEMFEQVSATEYRRAGGAEAPAEEAPTPTRRPSRRRDI